MQQRTDTSRVSIGSPFHADAYSPSSALWSGRRGAGGSLASHRRRREMQDLLEGFLLFESGGFSCRDVVAIGGPVGLGDGRLGRNDTHGWAPGDALGAEVRSYRGFIIGLGHRGTFCLSER